MVILRSTLSAGTMENIVKDCPEKKNLKFIYAPERIAEGKAVKELREMPQIIGSQNQEHYLLAESFFNSLGIKTLKMTYQRSRVSKTISQHLQVSTVFDTKFF